MIIENLRSYKVKIIISLILILFASTYYSQKIIGKKAEADLIDEVSKIVKQILLSLEPEFRLTGIMKLQNYVGLLSANKEER